MRVLAPAPLVGFLLLTGGCGTSPSPDSAQIALFPAASFETLEARLLGAREIQLGFHITSEGAFSADLEGDMGIASDGSVRLSATGDFGGERVDLLLVTEGGEYEFGNGPERGTAPVPQHLSEALLIGLTRMGLLHNLARLVGGAPPDRADGGVGDWVVVDSFGGEETPGGAADFETISFSIVVAGIPSGSASLELDPEGYPVERRQVVRFPEGEMRVVEKYYGVLIDP